MYALLQCYIDTYIYIYINESRSLFYEGHTRMSSSVYRKE